MTDHAVLLAFVEQLQGPGGNIATTRRALQLVGFGHSLGLTPQQVEEVFDAWLVWSEHHPEPFSWERVAEAAWARFNGKPWRPV